MSRTRNLAAFMVLGVMALPLLSCGSSQQTHLDSNSQVTADRATLQESTYDGHWETAKLDKLALQGVGDHYRQVGEGAVSIVVSYDPSSHINTAMRARNEAARIKATLRKYGVADISTDVLPSAGKGGKSISSITYNILEAREPDGCYAMGGLDNRPTEANPNYPFGCTTEMLLARQIAHPSDLKGRAGLDVSSGRRQANIPEAAYQPGTPNPPLQNAETASGSK